MSVNIKNPAIKRIHADVRELMKDPSDQYHAAPLESNLFEWHFTIRGPPDTEFEGGVYHGRIILPPEYPFRPPDIMFSTPNGRFSTGMKVCLTISSYHPEHWQPAWGIRLILEALISFFPSPSQGALGGLDWSPKERKRLAAESTRWKCYKCGLANDLLPELRPKGGGGAGSGAGSYAEQIRALHKLKAKTAEGIAAESLAAAPGGGGDVGQRTARGSNSAGNASGRDGGGIGAVSEKAVFSPKKSRGEKRSREASAASDLTPATAPSSPRTRGEGEAASSSAAGGNGGDATSSPASSGDDETSGVSTSGSGAVGRRQQDAVVVGGRLASSEREDDVLSFVAVAIALAIVGILVRKALRLLDVF